MEPAKLGLAGKPPSVTMGKIDPNTPRIVKVLTEKQKYEKMWKVEDYRKVSPGELAGNTFLSVVKPDRDSEVIDFGCGTGRGSFYLCFMGNMNVTSMDFASNCLDSDVKLAMSNYPERIRFVEKDLNEAPTINAKYGYCTDVMEHIPEDEVDVVIGNILESARHVFFRISTEPDVMGPKYLKQHLHLTVKDYAWWANKFIEHDATILYSENMRGAVDFYVTGWKKKLPDTLRVNTSKEQVLSNIRENSKKGCLHVRPHQLQDMPVMLLCGGPSLNDFEDEIIQKWKDGTKVVTVNGAYQWCQERGITNVNQCMLDARSFNKRFIEPVRDDCYYFISTQCDPSVFDALPPDRTFYWHCTTSSEAIEVIDECYPEYALCGGGSTVTLRALVLLRILGFKNQTIYGMDSCVTDGEHHAFKQEENDSKLDLVPVMVGDRTFHCQPWMAYQAFEFIEMLSFMEEEFSLTVKGNGLIAHIIETGAVPPDLEEV